MSKSTTKASVLNMMIVELFDESLNSWFLI